MDVSCTPTPTLATVGLPFIDWNGNGTGEASEIVTPGTDYCGQSITLASQTQMPLCGAGYMVMRTWKVRLCDGTFVSRDQSVNVIDLNMPVMRFLYYTYPRIEEVQKVNMGGMCIDQFVYKTVRDRANALAISDGYGGHQIGRAHV